MVLSKIAIYNLALVLLLKIWIFFSFFEIFSSYIYAAQPEECKDFELPFLVSVGSIRTYRLNHRFVGKLLTFDEFVSFIRDPKYLIIHALFGLIISISEVWIWNLKAKSKIRGQMFVGMLTKWQSGSGVQVNLGLRNPN